MTTDHDNELGETIPLILRPLTPDGWEQNQAIADALLTYVSGEPESENTPEAD